MAARTPEQNIALVFSYMGMPDQSVLANGSSHYLSYLGYTINQLKIANDRYNKKRVDTAAKIISGLKEDYSILVSQMPRAISEDGGLIFRTAVDEPVDVKTLIISALNRLNGEIGGLEANIAKNHGKLNKSQPKEDKIIYL